MNIIFPQNIERESACSSPVHQPPHLNSPTPTLPTPPKNVNLMSPFSVVGKTYSRKSHFGGSNGSIKSGWSLEIW